MFISTKKGFLKTNHQWLSITLKVNLNSMPWRAKQGSPQPCSPRSPVWLLSSTPAQSHSTQALVPPPWVHVLFHTPPCQKVMLLQLLFRCVLKSHLLRGWTILSKMALIRLLSTTLSCCIFLPSTHHYQKVCMYLSSIASIRMKLHENTESTRAA